MSERFKGSSRSPEGGFLATHKHDFNVHHRGEDWRHGARDIDMEPIITSIGGTTVQETLENLAAAIAAKGTGFISVGSLDGYDGYAVGSYNVGSPLTPTLDLAFAAAFADARLQNGGIVLLLAGTYELLDTVEVPPGITIMGELAGSIIVGHTIEKPLFTIKRGLENTEIGGDTGTGEIRLQAGDPLDATTFWNLIISDNLDGYVTSGGAPVATMQTVPMIDCEISSNFVARQCRFIGRVNNGPQSNRSKTQESIGGYTAGGSLPSSLVVEECYFDGLKRGLSFTPGGGDDDILVVDKCRARIFGTEDIAQISVLAENTFVNFSLCNARFTNNHIVSFLSFPDGTMVSAFLCSSIPAGSDDATLTIIGNTGGSALSSARLLFSTEVGLSFDAIKTVQYGNSWGSNIGTTWFVTVGQVGDATLLDNIPGDFVGSGAIDKVLQAGFSYPTTVIVNPGTYIITNEGSNNYNFIGNTYGVSARPTFQMNLGAGATTDHLGNRLFICGRIFEGIDVKTEAALAGGFHSIRPNGGAGTEWSVYVKNCHFLNTTLSIDDGAGQGPLTENIITQDCTFEQNDDFDDNACILMPVSQLTLVERCLFIGNGYGGLIGRDSGLSYNAAGSSADFKKVVIRDCNSHPNGENIDNATPFALGGWLIVDAPEADVLIENCTIAGSIDDRLLKTTGVVNAALDTEFFRWVYVNAGTFTMNNTTIHAPSMTFDVGGTNYPMPALEVVPQNSARFNHSRIIDGGMPLKIGGVDAFTGSIVNVAEGVFLDGCTLSINVSGPSDTVLDIELETAGSNGVVSITNCNFQHIAHDGVANLSTYHTLITGGDYIARGGLQIFAQRMKVHLHNNTMRLPSEAGKAGSFGHLAGVVINTYDGSLASSTSDPIIVSNNDILFTGEFSSASAGESSSVMWIKGTTLNINNNILRMSNQAALSSSFIGCLYLDLVDTSGGNTPEPAMITGNIISRRDISGSDTDLNRGYIQIASTTDADGMIIDNIFSDDTIDGTSIVFYEDNSAGSVNWIVDKNKNQQVTIEVQAGMGMFMLNGAAVGTASLASVSRIEVEHVAPSGLGTSPLMQFFYADSPATTSFEWTFNASNYIPFGAEIIDVSVRHDAAGGVPDTTNDLSIRVYDSGGTADSTTVNPSTSPTTSTLTTSTASRNYPDQMLYVQIHYLCDDSAITRQLDVLFVTLTYKL